MRFTSDKLVYIDFNDIIFANLYIGKDTKDTQSMLVDNKSFSCDVETATGRPEWPDPHGLCENA